MKKKFIPLFVSALLVSALSSCSLLGYGIGSLIDHGAAHDTVAIFTDISSYTGQRACIHYPDSSIRFATFEDYSDEPSDSYRNDYNKYAASHPASPVFGDTVRMEYHYHDEPVIKYSAPFRGYCPEGIFFGYDKLPFTKFDHIIYPKSLSEPKLKMLIESSSVPIRATLNFRDSAKSFSLTNRDFQNVFVLPHNAPGRWIGLGIGAAADLAIAIWFANLADAGPKPFSFAKAHYNGGVMH